MAPQQWWPGCHRLRCCRRCRTEAADRPGARRRMSRRCRRRLPAPRCRPAANSRGGLSPRAAHRVRRGWSKRAATVAPTVRERHLVRRRRRGSGCGSVRRRRRRGSHRCECGPPPAGERANRPGRTSRARRPNRFCRWQPRWPGHPRDQSRRLRFAPPPTTTPNIPSRRVIERFGYPSLVGVATRRATVGFRGRRLDLGRCGTSMVRGAVC